MSSLFTELDILAEDVMIPPDSVSTIDEPVAPEDPPIIDPPIVETPITAPPEVLPQYSLQIQWQSPSYLLLKEDGNLPEYICDSGNSDCKINLLVMPLVDGIGSSELTCEVLSDFELIPTLDPCNPNTSLVPKGDHVLTIKIVKKSDNTLVTTRDIVLKNPIVDTSIDPLRVTSTLVWQSPTDLI